MIDQYEEAVNKYKLKVALIPYPLITKDHRAVYDASLVALRHHDKNHFTKKILVSEQPHSYIWDYNHNIAGAL